MSLQGGDLSAQLSLDYRQFTQGLRAAAQQAKQAGREFRTAFQEGNAAIRDTSQALKGAQKDFKDFERIVSGILLSQAFYGATTAIKDAAANVVQFTSDMEKAQISMEYFLGSEAAASGFLTNMKDFAAETSFNTNQAIELSKKLLNAKFQAGEIRSIMERLNDTAAVSGMTPETIDRIVLAFTQMKTSGKIMGTELRQLAEANIPVYKILAEQLGLTGEQILNIGEMKIPSDIGIAAIFKGLEKFEGAALRVAQTVPGMWETIKDDSLIASEKLFAAPYAALKSFLKGWRDGMEEIRKHLTNGGLGEVMEKMVPPELHTSIRLIVGGVKSLARSFMDFHKAMLPTYQVIVGSVVAALGIIIPIIAAVSRGFTMLVTAAFTTAPALKYLAAAILGLVVAQVAAKALWFLWGVMRLGVVAAAVGQAVLYLGNALKYLFLMMTRNPLTLAITVIAAALLYLALSSKTVSAWLDTVMQKLASLGGFDLGEILQPKDLNMDDWSKDFNNPLADLDPGMIDQIGDQLEDTGEKGKKAGKKIKDSFLAAFDEVFNVPEKQDPTGGGGAGPGAPKMPGMPDLGGLIPENLIPKMPREIEMPKLVVPPVDWPVIPPMLTKPIKIKFEMPKFPTLPGPPAALVTSWQWSMDKIRAYLKGFELSLEGLRVKVPSIIPQIMPQGVWNPVLEGLGNFGKSFGGAFDALKERMMGQWGAAWQGMLGTVSTFTAGVLANLVAASPGWVTAIGTALSAMNVNFKAFSSVASLTWTALWAAIKIKAFEFGTAFKEVMKISLDAIANFWEEHKWKVLAVVGALVAAVLLYFFGIPAGILAAVAALLARLGPALMRIGPLFVTAIKGVPAFFTKVFSKLPVGAQTVITKIIASFKTLPQKIWEAIKSIPGKMADVFAKIKIPSFSTMADGVTASFRSLGTVAGFAGGGIIGKDSIVRVGEGGRREAIVPLQNDSAMQPYVDAVVRGVLAATGTGGGNNSNSEPQPIMHVGTLIADERSLRELERRMQVVRQGEKLRGVLT